MTFFQAVYDLVGRVPPGKVVTYAQIALALGMPHGARAVGWAMRQCPEDVPWHRVINRSGHISAPPQSERYQRHMERLIAEGVIPDSEGCFDFTRYGWDEV